jgi:hypothetical protein
MRKKIVFRAFCERWHLYHPIKGITKRHQRTGISTYLKKERLQKCEGHKDENKKPKKKPRKGGV